MADSKHQVPPVRKVRGKPFEKGNSGRPRGARNKRTLAFEALLDGQAEAIIRRAIDLALNGDPTALKLCVERILGARRDRPVLLDLPPIVTAADGKVAMSAVLAAVADGQITPTEGGAVSELITATIRVIETADLEQRIEILEAGAPRQQGEGDGSRT